MDFFNLHGQFLDSKLAGNQVRDWVVAGLLLVLGWLLGRLVGWLMTRWLPLLTSFTRSDIDDKLVARTARPVAWVVTFAIANVAFGVLTLPARAQALLAGAVMVAIAVTLAVIVMRTVDVLFEEIGTPWATQRQPPINVQVLHIGRISIKVLAGTVAMVTVMQRAGFDVWSVITGLGIGGVAMALGAQQTLSNLFGSLQIMTDQPFAVGDWIRVDTFFGRVTHIGLRSSRLQNTAGLVMVIPNKHIAEATIENHMASQGQVREFVLGLTYDMSGAQLRLACDVVAQILTETSGIHPEFQVTVWHFAESSVQLRVIYRVPDPTQFGPIAHTVNLAIREAFDRHGLKFAFPTRTVHLMGDLGGASKSA